MNKDSAFNRAFRQPVQFWDGNDFWLISAELYPTREEAAEAFAEFWGDPVDAAELEQDAVRYGYFPTEMECVVEHRKGDSGWWSGARGRGAKPVWSARW